MTIVLLVFDVVLGHIDVVVRPLVALHEDDAAVLLIDVLTVALIGVLGVFFLLLMLVLVHFKLTAFMLHQTCLWLFLPH